jgi:prefoldin subunit 5
MGTNNNQKENPMTETTTTASIDTLIERIRNEDEYRVLARRCDSLNRTHRDLRDALYRLARKAQSITDNAITYFTTSSRGTAMESPCDIANEVDRLMTQQNNLMESIHDIAALSDIDVDTAEVLIEVVLLDAANGLRF